MSLVEGLRASPEFLSLSVLLLGLCAGSFLNVVIHRLPQMVSREWRRDCRELLELAPVEEPKVSLVFPASHCPACRAPIKPWHNVPVVSWLLLRGRCAACAAPISPQYPLVEVLTGLLSLACAMRFGWSAQLLPALALTWTLIVLSVIDIKTQYLYSDLTLPLMWAGLLLSLWGVFVPPQVSIVGAAAGYLSLWSFYWVFKVATGKEGFGYGDFALMAALGAWLGWAALPQIVILSAGVGSVVGITLILAGKAEWSGKTPFGPYIAAAGWIAMMWGGALNRAYLGVAFPH